MSVKRKVKIIEVDACCNCPFIEPEEIDENVFDYCWKYDLIINDNSIIHPDCKLDDK